MSTLRGEQALYDLAEAGHGALATPNAVFGLGSDPLAEPPAWLAEPAEVRRRLRAKPAEDGVPGMHWPGVVEFARQCAEVAADVTDEGAAPADVVHRALTLSTALARRLPKPPVALVDTGAFPPAAEVVAEHALECGQSTPDDLHSAGLYVDGSFLLGHWQDRLREQACRLADAVDDPWWTDPDALAGIVDDTRRVLAGYLVTVIEFGAGPMPAPRHRVRHRTGALTRHRAGR